MAPKKIVQYFAARFVLSMFLAFSLLGMLAPQYAQAKADSTSIPELSIFIEQVKNGDAHALRGVYVANVMAYPIVPQPKNDTGFVSEKSNEVTQFSLASRKGNIGLLAHNTLAGESFFNVTYGSIVTLVYGDGSTESFEVETISIYQALPYNRYKNLQTQETVYVTNVFNKAYGGDYHVTLQTCVEMAEDEDWGRMFIIAKPIKH